MIINLFELKRGLHNSKGTESLEFFLLQNNHVHLSIHNCWRLLSRLIYCILLLSRRSADRYCTNITWKQNSQWQGWGSVAHRPPGYTVQWLKDHYTHDHELFAHLLPPNPAVSSDIPFFTSYHCLTETAGFKRRKNKCNFSYGM